VDFTVFRRRKPIAPPYANERLRSLYGPAASKPGSAELRSARTIRANTATNGWQQHSAQPNRLGDSTEPRLREFAVNHDMPTIRQTTATMLRSVQVVTLIESEACSQRLLRATRPTTRCRLTMLSGCEGDERRSVTSTCAFAFSSLLFP